MYTFLMFRSYDKNGEISYSLGAFPTVELVKKRPADLLGIALHSKFRMTKEVEEILGSMTDKIITSDRAVERVAKKGNTFMVGAFKKRYSSFNGRHVCLVNPSDAGNLGTIMRTMLGFGISNLAVVGESVDVYSPAVVRASMGAIFSLNISLFADWQEYASAHTEPKYLFMLDKRSHALSSVQAEELSAYVFGNEGSGLPSELAQAGLPVIIPHSKDIDSLNLPQAVAIGLYELTKGKF